MACAKRTTGYGNVLAVVVHGNIIIATTDIAIGDIDIGRPGINTICIRRVGGRADGYARNGNAVVVLAYADMAVRRILNFDARDLYSSGAA